SPYRMMNMVSDVVALVYALGYNQVDMLVGHDIGSGIASYCALLRPDIFKSLAMLSVPFAGPPLFSSLNSTWNSSETTLQELDEALRKLEEPKKHYMVYFSSPEADGDLSHPPQGVHNFTQSYYFIKSAGWAGNSRPHAVNSSDLASIASNTTIEAQALAQIMPPYYIMPSNQTMSGTVSSFSPTPDEIKQQEAWLPDDELEVYISTYNRTGFQGGLNYYRGQSFSPIWMADINKLAAGKKVEVPAMFLAGKEDWGAYLFPGVLERMRNDTISSMGEAKNVFEKMREEDLVLIEGAGHWLQQEKPDEVVEHLKRFISETRS
ncbi:alpha/beta-hydrolase, partial [Agrocybe pediades]